jgi:transposase-like protein
MKPGDSITADEIVKIHTLAVLERKKGDQQAAAKTLGIDRKTLYRWLRAWGLIKGWFAKQLTLAESPAAPPPSSTPAPRTPTELTPAQKLRYDPPTLL